MSDALLTTVMAGLVPAIRVFLRCSIAKTWMPGTRPGMTEKVAQAYFFLAFFAGFFAAAAIFAASIAFFATSAASASAFLIALA